MNRQIRVLVVEDEEAIRTGLIDVLVFHGYEVDCAAAGPEGLEKALTGLGFLIICEVSALRKLLLSEVRVVI